MSESAYGLPAAPPTHSYRGFQPNSYEGFSELVSPSASAHQYHFSSALIFLCASQQTAVPRQSSKVPDSYKKHFCLEACEFQ